MNRQLIKGYLKECKSGKEPSVKTFFEGFEDDKYLYFHFDSQEIFSYPRHTQYNKPLYEGDTVEVFLTLDSPNRYLEIEVNQYNAGYCVIIDNKDGKGDIIISKIEKCVFKSANTFEKDMWRCEIKIAKKKLYELGWKEDNALINACRQDFDKDKNLNIYSFFPTYSKTFHKVKAFQKLYKGEKAMKILVTGGAGYIASHTNVALLQRGYDVVAVDNLCNSSLESIKRVEQITGKKISFYEGDVGDKKLLDKVFNENKIDAVIHFAGLKAVGESCLKPLLYYENNLMANIALVSVMSKYNVKKLVFSSSATVYGVPERLPLTEDSPLSAVNPYGSTKLMGERIFCDLQNADKYFHIILLRYFNPVGAHESGKIGEDPKGIPNNLMPYISQVAIGKLDKLKIFGNDYDTHDGTGVRDYIHVMDLAMAHLKALENIEKYGIEPFNVGTGQGYSVLDMVKAFEKASGKKIDYEFVPRRAGDVDECYANCDKAKSELGFVAKKGLFDMCKDLWRWQTLNPNGYEN